MNISIGKMILIINWIYLPDSWWSLYRLRLIEGIWMNNGKLLSRKRLKCMLFLMLLPFNYRKLFMLSPLWFRGKSVGSVKICCKSHNFLSLKMLSLYIKHNSLLALLKISRSGSDNNSMNFTNISSMKPSGNIMSRKS